MQQPPGRGGVSVVACVMSMDTTSIASLYAEEHSRLKRMLVRRGMSAQNAADVVQEAFIRLLRSQNEEIRDPQAYLRRTTESAAIDYYRHEQRVSRLVVSAAEPDETVADSRPLPDALIVTAEEIATLTRAMQDLPPRAREVMMLHKFEGLSYGEIAEQLGIAKNTVMVHMVKALSVLKARMRENNPHQD